MYLILITNCMKQRCFEYTVCEYEFEYEYTTFEYEYEYDVKITREALDRGA